MTKENLVVNLTEVQIKNLVDLIRPPVEIRSQLDIGYRFFNNILEIFEIRPRWDKPDEIIHSPVAKTKYIKSRKLWRIYWKRANGRWVQYDPNSEVTDIFEFFKILKADEYGCFWG